MDLFEVAAREKDRYPFNGSISTEDLFDLSMPNLNKVYQSLYAQKKKSENVSLMKKPSDADLALDRKIEIVQYIFDYKNALAERAEKAAETRQRNQKILDIINKKQDEELAGKSIEELRQMLQSVDG